MDALVVQGEISSKIVTLRGRQVMIDRDLAELYEVETTCTQSGGKKKLR